MKIKTNVAAGASECTLASPEEALQFCRSGQMGSWHIGLINSGDAGVAQRGPGYGCDQKNESGNGIGHAICV